MAVLSPDHLLAQAEKLTVSSLPGPARQVDLRRAVSSAYYGVFHFTLTALADEFVGVTQRGTGRYSLVYRSVDHRALRELCVEAQKPTLSQRYASYTPSGGFSGQVKVFASTAIELQEKRHRADYNPMPLYKASDAHLAVVTARRAINVFQSASSDQRKTFLTLLLCPPR